MAGNKYFRLLEKELKKFGFEFSFVNSKGKWVYTHPQHEAVNVLPGLGERGMRELVLTIQKTCGVHTPTPKRDASRAKERQAKERQKLNEELDRLNARRQKFIDERDRQLAGIGARLETKEINQIVQHIEELDRRRREIEKLMNAPVGGSHFGSDRVSHQAGSR